MKKLLLLAVVALFAISCEGPRGMDGQDGVYINTVKLTVKQGEWKRNGAANALNSFYYCEVKMPEIDQYIFEDGTVVAYFLNGNMKETLPFVVHNGAIVEGYNYFWTETIDFSYQRGYMTFYVKRSDFLTGENYRPKTMDFDVVLMW